MKHQAGYIPVKRKASCLFARIKRLILSADFTIVVLVGEDAEGGNDKMILYTERLILRPWSENDAKSLFEYAKDPEVGPVAGWLPHKSTQESLEVIRHVLNGAECYAICEKGSSTAIGAIELRLNGATDMTKRDDECELGYWIGKPFWGRGYVPEAAKEVLRRGFEELGMTTIWCGYYDGNEKSKRVQEKLGFVYHHTCTEVPVPCMNEIRTGHTNYMTKEQWKRNGCGNQGIVQEVKNTVAEHRTK